MKTENRQGDILCGMIYMLGGFFRPFFSERYGTGYGNDQMFSQMNQAALARLAGRLLPDAGADHYLTIEDAVTVAELLLSELTGRK